jgi:hypothetical protein
VVPRRDTHVSWLTVSALARVASRFEACSRPGLGSFDVDVGEPGKPGRQVPVALAEQLHRGRDQYEADDGGVEQQGDGYAEPICRNMTRSPRAKPLKTAMMISAAPVMIRPVEPTP